MWWKVFEVADRRMSCIICGELIDFYMLNGYIKLTEKEYAGIKNAINQRNLDTPDLWFSEHRDDLVHNLCRSRHTNAKAIQITQKHQSSHPVVREVNLCI